MESVWTSAPSCTGLAVRLKSFVCLGNIAAEIVVPSASRVHTMRAVIILVRVTR
jgi:hypothetical protein